VARGLICAILNPREVRRSAEAMGVLEETDRIDAGIFAWCAEVKQPRPYEPAGKTQERLTALVLRLRQFTELRTAQANQRRFVSDPTALASFEEILVPVPRQTRPIEADIAALIDGDRLWSALDKAFRSVKASPTARSPA
jgi:transposase